MNLRVDTVLIQIIGIQTVKYKKRKACTTHAYAQTCVHKHVNADTHTQIISQKYSNARANTICYTHKIIVCYICAIQSHTNMSTYAIIIHTHAYIRINTHMRTNTHTHTHTHKHTHTHRVRKSEKSRGYN